LLLPVGLLALDFEKATLVPCAFAFCKAKAKGGLFLLPLPFAFALSLCLKPLQKHRKSTGKAKEKHR
jgi:hypothetical protein